MSRLMGQVLDVLKIESHIGLGIAMAKLDLADIVTDVVDDARHDYPDIDFHLSIIGDAIVDGDADRLVQVASNLLGNARAHGQLGEPSKVTLETVAD